MAKPTNEADRASYKANVQEQDSRTIRFTQIQ
jgi:hypothetical protein